MNERGEFVEHISCPKCGSSDGRALYSNGSSYCFVCETWFPPEGGIVRDSGFTNEEFNPVETVPITQKIRGISPKTFQMFNYYKDKEGNHLINHFDKEGVLIAQKFRYPDKTFRWIGNPKKAVPFGMNLWRNGGKKITITEGELDALSVAEAFDRKWSVISVNNGAGGAYRDLQRYVEFLNSYDEIYLWFDNDKPGQEAVRKVSSLFPPGKVFVVTHPTLKDANEVLQKEGKSGVVKTFYNAKKYRPDGIINAKDISFDDLINDEDIKAYPTPYNKLNEKLVGGFEKGRLAVITAGCVDEDTEYLTKNGWKKIKDFNEGDEICVVDGKTFEAFYEEPFKYHKYYTEEEGYFVKPDNRTNTNMFISGEHKMLVLDEKNKIKTYKADEFFKKSTRHFKIPSIFYLGGQDVIDLSEAELRLQVAVCADGSIRNNQVHLHLKKERKKERLRNLLNQAGYIYKTYVRKDGYETFVFYPPILTKKLHTFSYNLNKEHLKIIADEVIYWDGALDRRTRLPQFFTTIKEEADFIQYVFSQIYDTIISISTYDRIGQERGKYIRKTKEYIVRVTKTKYKNIVKDKVVRTKFPNNYKYCFTTSTGFWLARRGDYIFVTGNSGIGKSTFTREIAYEYAMKQDLKIGFVALEENNKRSALGFMGIYLNKPLHLRPILIDYKEKHTDKLNEAYQEVLQSGKFYLYDHFGSLDSKNLLEKLRFLAVAEEVDFIILDHISIVVSGDDTDNERKAIDMLMTNLRSLAEETGVGIIVVSHLRRPTNSNKGFEDGLQITLSHLRGSGAIAQLADYVIALERNQQDEETKNIANVRVLKNRVSGETGLVQQVEFNTDTGRLLNYNEFDDEETFESEEVDEW